MRGLSANKRVRPARSRVAPVRHLGPASANTTPIPNPRQPRRSNDRAGPRPCVARSMLYRPVPAPAIAASRSKQGRWARWHRPAADDPGMTPSGRRSCRAGYRRPITCGVISSRHRMVTQRHKQAKNLTASEIGAGHGTSGAIDIRKPAMPRLPAHHQAYVQSAHLRPKGSRNRCLRHFAAIQPVTQLHRLDTFNHRLRITQARPSIAIQFRLAGSTAHADKKACDRRGLRTQGLTQAICRRAMAVGPARNIICDRDELHAVRRAAIGVTAYILRCACRAPGRTAEYRQVPSRWELRLRLRKFHPK